MDVLSVDGDVNGTGTPGVLRGGVSVGKEVGSLADADRLPGVPTRPADLQTVPPATPWHTLLPTLDALRRHRTAVDPTPPRDRRGPPRKKPLPRPGHTESLDRTAPLLPVDPETVVAPTFRV